MQTFWDRVKYLLDKRNAKNPWLSRESGIPVNTIRNWKKKGTLPRVDEAAQIARALDTSVDYLATGRVIDMETDEDLLAIIEGLREADHDSLRRIEGVLMTMGLFSPAYVSNKKRVAGE